MDVILEVLAFSRDYVNGNQTTERRDKIAAAYRKATGETLRKGCSTCYIEALFQIKKAMERKPCSYRLKPGAVLTAFGDESKICTNKNITDELAEFHLRTNPGSIKYFEIYPGHRPWISGSKELEIVPVSVPVKEPAKEPVKEPAKVQQELKKELQDHLLGKKGPIKEPEKPIINQEPFKKVPEKKQVRNKGGRFKR